MLELIRRERVTTETRALSGVKGSGFLYCGRPSHFGNPWKVNAHNNRADAISMFAQEFEKDLQLQEDFLYAARQAWKPGFGIVLLCWCRGFESCHTDILIEFLKMRAEEKK